MENEPQSIARDEDEPELARIVDRIEKLEGRDFQLWSIIALIVVVLGSAIVAVLFPNLAWGELAIGAQYVPQLLYGLISLIVLLNVYLFDQRRRLRNTRRELIRELIRSEALERRSLVDPLTETFNRRYLEEVLPIELSRIERRGGSLAFLMIDLDEFRAINNRFGHPVGDSVLRSIAELLRMTFRKADSIVRYGGDEFLVILSDADLETTGLAEARLVRALEDWNRTENDLDVKIHISSGIAIYEQGSELSEVLAEADREMFRRKSEATREATS